MTNDQNTTWKADEERPFLPENNPPSVPRTATVYLQGPNGEEAEVPKDSVTVPDPDDGTYCINLLSVLETAEVLNLRLGDGRRIADVVTDEYYLRLVPNAR